MSPPSSDATPNDPAADTSSGSAAGSMGDRPPFDWNTFVPRLLHPRKVAIIEALLVVGRPMSASDFSRSFGPTAGSLSAVSYHVRAMAEAGVIKLVEEHQGVGAIEKFYVLS